MLKFKYILLATAVFLVCSGSVFAGSDQGDEPGKTVNGLKQGLWIYLGKHRPEMGYPENGKIEEGSYIDDRKEGFWVRYHMDGVTPKLKGEFHDNIPNGHYIKFYPNGVAREEGNFQEGKYQDSLTRYREDGTIEYVGFYNPDGQEQGPVKYYFPNGQLEYEYNAQNGLPTGKGVRYYENGDIKQIIYYDESGKITKKEDKPMVNPPVTVVDPGLDKEKAPKLPSSPNTRGVKFEPNGYNKVFNENQEIWQDGDFKNGRLYDGKVYEYDADGILLKVKIFKNGTYHSDGQL